MVAVLVTCAIVLVAAGAEILHVRRCRVVAPLVFGPAAKPAPWVRLTPLLRVAAVGALAWGLVTLMLLKPKVHQAEVTPQEEYRHLLLVLDVSPSMRLPDAGPTGEQSRLARGADIMQSFFERVDIGRHRLTIVAFYTGAKPVVEETTDLEVVENILNDLPMHYAFQVGETDLFSGLKEAARIAHPWNPKSATLVLLSDGDTVPATGMPKMPASVRDVVVVGVGDPVTGMFIDGRHSRQDVSTLRQVAIRLGGTYHNGNEKHLSTKLLERVSRTAERSKFEQLTRREYALMACGAGGSILALLPLLLHVAGTGWKPGVRPPSRTRPLPEARVDRERAGLQPVSKPSGSWRLAAAQRAARGVPADDT